LQTRFVSPLFFRQKHHSQGVAALVFREEALAVAAQLARVVFGYGVGAVVAYDVVDSVA
jgi:hypothetical protein